MEVLDAVKFFIQGSWGVLSSIKVPGFEFSFATLFIGLFIANLGLRFLGMVLGVGFGHEDVVRAEDSGILKRKNKTGKIGF